MLEIFLEHSQLFLQNSFVKTPSTDKRKSAHFVNQQQLINVDDQTTIRTESNGLFFETKEDN